MYNLRNKLGFRKLFKMNLSKADHKKRCQQWAIRRVPEKSLNTNETYYYKINLPIYHYIYEDTNKKTNKWCFEFPRNRRDKVLLN